MLQPNELERCAMMLTPQMDALEMRIMEDIVRRIRINGEITSAADWQMNRLYELGMSKRELKKILQRELGLDKAEISHMYKQVLRMGYARSKELYKARGKPWIPFDQNAGLQLLINAVAEQTTQTIQNITQSLGFAVRMPNGHLAFQPIADYYQKTLDAAMLDISSGAFDYNTVLKRTVREMTNSGLRTVDYASGHSNRVEVAARRAVMTGLTQLTDKVTEDNARELETDMWEITWHSGFRPEHWWGGRWYSFADLVKVCGYGTVTGLCGANCYHQKFPVIPGISEPTYTQEELDRLNAEEQKPREFGGKTYTKYEALQHQRRLETTMRAQRQEIKLLQDGGAAEEDVIAARARYRGTSAEYARFSQAVDLPQQRERVTVDGLGNIGQGKYTGGSDKPAMKQRVGSKITGTVTDQERAELLEHPRTVMKSLTNSGGSGIIKAKGYPEDHFDRKAQLSTADEDLKAVNPKFKTEVGYDNNCQRCVPAYILRRMGFNVEALPTGMNPAVDRFLMDNPSAVWKINGSPVIPKSTRGSKYYGKPEIENFMKNLPDGAMCEIRCAWASGIDGHVFIAEKVNGKVRYIDPQTGETDVSWYFSRMRVDKTTFWRIDNAAVDDDLIQYCCKNK